jgi:dolichol-phosphate mannosyltransferase
MDISIIIPALDEGANLAVVLPQIVQTLAALGVASEILIVTRQIDDLTARAAAANGAAVLTQQEPGYGGALVAGFAVARGEYVLTMDADASHPPACIESLWQARERAEVVIASRYVPGGAARMPRSRYVLSRILNAFFSLGLDVPIRDVSSGFRLYKGSVLRQQTYAARDFDILE